MIVNRVQPRLFLDQDMRQAELLPVAGGWAAVYTARSPSKTTPNEDAAAVIPFDEQSVVLAVADGVGGMAAGAQAAQRALEALCSSVQEAAQQGWMLRTAILNGLENANHAVQALGGAATTLAAVEVQCGRVRPYHVGDSIILVVGQRGRMKLQTISHSPIGYAVESGLLDVIEAMHHEDRHLVSNVVGTADMRIEIGSGLQMAPRDTLLVASDGLLDNLHLTEIVQHIRKGPLDQAMRRLADNARQRMLQPADAHPCKPDDLTMIVFRRARSQPAADGKTGGQIEQAPASVCSGSAPVEAGLAAEVPASGGDRPLQGESR